MPIDKPSIRVFFDDESLRLKFKQLAVVAKISMTKRVIQFIEKDVAFWEQTGEILDLNVLDGDIKADSQLDSQRNNQTEKHHAPQQVKITKPRKQHKSYKDKVGDLLAELSENQVKVGLDDGTEEIFYRDEVEIIE
ncbi:MAG: hypothetical protein F6K40_12370 [Okeania sp. SIO3I5]|uniref:hypothetical protein n=1 Tax=Okeania sp. SIO3I5 TaxID=2607805 RepID=UPI0013BB51B0|nr:hypothetical protein [Okeania sp. SIO3I5]NEQ37025.1 hypothetical protein [Okeania sp. SIO3I5]